MEIKTITRYKFDGKEYDLLPAIKTELENRIGKIIDSVEPPLTAKQRLALLKVIIKNRNELVKCLTVTYDAEPDTLHGDNRNILDI